MHQLTEIVVRTEPFYTPTSGGSLLNQFRTEWNTNMQDVPRDITHLMTGKPGSLIEFGGLAFVGVVCTSSQFGWSMDGANIVGHEVGHNWGAPHCLDPAPCNNMCGACLLILENTKDVIEAHRDSRACLDDVGPFTRPVPPYATPESRRVLKNLFLPSRPLEFDILANDHDGNCEPISVVDFDALSAKGAGLSLHAGEGPQGRPLLVYTPPEEVFIGDDTFSYTIEDSSGRRATALQTVTVQPSDLRHAWSFDETSGSTAADGADGSDGTGSGALGWTAGIFGGALEFDGTQELVTDAGSFGRPWSVSVWARRRPGSTGSATILSAANGELRLQHGAQERVAVSTNQGVFTFDYSAPIDTWVHLAFVGSSEGVELWVNGQLEDMVPGILRAPTGPIGSTSTPLFAALDELRVYDYRLQADQIAELIQHGGRAAVPSPLDGGELVFPDQGLSWLAGPQAASHDVYFGTSYTAVRDATPASPEYQGNILGTSFLPGALSAGQTYFWRVDGVDSSTATGEVWQFEPIEAGHWPLDETTGTAAANVGNGPDAVYVGGVVLGQPGAQPFLGNSILLDGDDDRARIPALNLNTDRLTITCWLRRDGTQLDWAGIVFCRAGSTNSGLNFGPDEELRYHWDGGAWPWDSGLVVPDGEWVFTALVVEPDRATIYLGQNGTLTSATNVQGHAVEAFDASTFIGRDNGFSNRDFKGGIDDVRIFRAALTADDIAELFAN